jgi:hypothetical protein
LIPLPTEITAAQIPQIFLLVVGAALLMKILPAVTISLLEISIRTALDLIPWRATIESSRRKTCCHVTDVFLLHYCLF